MPRSHRIWIAGGLYHITLRGNNRQPIFLDATDYQQYLRTIRGSRAEDPFRLIAFTLMPNHVHLVMEALPECSLSDTMHRISTSYTRFFNGRHGRVGHLYQGRFYSNAISTESYAMEVTRYVHLNPVRAGLVQHPAAYPWTSYPVYIGAAEDPLRIVECGAVLSLFGSSPARQAAAYRRFVEDLAADERRLAGWMRGLRRNHLIPPTRWLTPNS